MLDEIYNLDDALTEDEYYDALLYLLGDVYPDMSEEELEDMLEDILEQMPERNAENVLQTVGGIGKKIGSGTLQFAAKNPALVKGILSTAGAVVGGPVGAKLGGSLGNVLTQTGKNKMMPETGKALALMQDPQAQAALALTTMGVGNGTAPMVLNGNKIQIPAQLYLRAMISVAQSALKEMDFNNVIPPASLTEDLPYSDNVDKQAEWLVEQILQEDTRSDVLALTWVAVKASKNRVYFVTSGGNNANNSPIVFHINIRNTNDVINIYTSKVRYALRFKDNNIDHHDKIFNINDPKNESKKADYSEMKFRREIEDETSVSLKIPISLEAINEAYKKLNDKEPHMQLEVQISWKDGPYFYQIFYCDFYLMRPIELLYSELIDFESHELSKDVIGDIKYVNIIKSGKKIKLKYPDFLNKIKVELHSSQEIEGSFKYKIINSIVDAKTHSISLTISRTDSEEKGEKESVKSTIKSIGSIDAGFMKSGLEASTEIGTEFHKNVVNTAQLTSAYLNSQTIQKSFSIETEQLVQLSKKDGITSIWVKPKFRPVAVKLVRYEGIDAYGIAHTRVEEPDPIIIWVNAGYHFYKTVQPRSK